MKIIGLNGFKGSGKNTVFDLLAEEAYGIAAKGFADKLKIIAALSLGFTGPDEDLIATMDEFKETGTLSHGIDKPEQAGLRSELTGRQFLQNLGHNAREVFGDTFWIDQVLPLDGFARSAVWAPDSCADEPAYAFITDLRYENEAERVMALKGEVWEIVRPGTESDGHATEQPLPRRYITRQIVNDSDLGELQRKALEAIWDWGSDRVDGAQVY